MDRRIFLKTSLFAPFCLKEILLGAKEGKVFYTGATQKSFEALEIKGTYHQIGYQIGKRFGKHIEKVIRRRSNWHSKLLTILNSREGRDYSKELLRLTQKYFPHLLQEIRGMADGAGISFHRIWAMCIKSELLARMPQQLSGETCVQARESIMPGCSTIFFRDKNNAWLFHNEDGNAAYQDVMFMTKVTPPSGVRFISMVYPGIITGNGPNLNDRGVIQTTNYIGSTKSQTGIPRYVISRAVLEAKDAKEAVEITTCQPRCYPSHHHIASFTDQTYYSIETTPEEEQIEEPDGVYFHTNHLIFDRTKRYKYEDNAYKNTSSLSRYEVIQERLLKLNPDYAKPGDFLDILSSHQNAPYSPCRHPEGDVQGATLGTAFFDLKKRSFRIYKGNPCGAVENQRYVELGF